MTYRKVFPTNQFRSKHIVSAKDEIITLDEELSVNQTLFDASLIFHIVDRAISFCSQHFKIQSAKIGHCIAGTQEELLEKIFTKYTRNSNCTRMDQRSIFTSIRYKRFIIYLDNWLRFYGINAHNSNKIDEIYLVSLLSDYTTTCFIPASKT